MCLNSVKEPPLEKLPGKTCAPVTLFKLESSLILEKLLDQIHDVSCGPTAAIQLRACAEVPNVYRVRRRHPFPQKKQPSGRAGHFSLVRTILLVQPILHN